jgi:hypothetical protein
MRSALRDVLSRDGVAARGWLDPGVVQDVVRQFEAGAISWAQPWLLMVLELWARAVLDPPAAAREDAAGGPARVGVVP